MLWSVQPRRIAIPVRPIFYLTTTPGIRAKTSATKLTAHVRDRKTHLVQFVAYNIAGNHVANGRRTSKVVRGVLEPDHFVLLNLTSL